MAHKKVISVVGAVGAQGGGLGRAVLADPGGGFAVPGCAVAANISKALTGNSAAVLAQ